MLRHMRTSIDMPDALLDDARRLAQDTGVTLRELVIQGLREVVVRCQASQTHGYRLPACQVGGQGLQPGVADLRWESLRDLVHAEAEHFAQPS